jgi:hypothetical protein
MIILHIQNNQFPNIRSDSAGVEKKLAQTVEEVRNQYPDDSLMPSIAGYPAHPHKVFVLY